MEKKEFCVKTTLKELIHRYRNVEKFIGYCKECSRYNACWACPPFDFNADEYLTPYGIAYINGTLPEYFTFVSGFFSLNEIPVLQQRSESA